MATTERPTTNHLKNMKSQSNHSRLSLLSAIFTAPALLWLAAGSAHAEKLAVEKDYLKLGFSGAKVEAAKQLAACC